MISLQFFRKKNKTPRKRRALPLLDRQKKNYEQRMEKKNERKQEARKRKAMTVAKIVEQVLEQEQKLLMKQN